MTAQRDISGRAWLGLALLAIIWGASFLSIRIALDEVTVLWSVAWRVSLGAATLGIYILARRLRLPREPRIWGAFLVMGLLNNVVPFTLMAWGQLHIESGLTAIFNATTAVFGVIVAAIVFADERLTARRAFGVALGFAGVVTAIGWQALTELDLRSLAQIAVVAGTLSYALAGAYARIALSGLRPEVAAFGMLVASSLFMLPIAGLVEGAPILALSPNTCLAIAYYGVVATAGAYLLYYWVLAQTGAGNLLLVTLMIAPIAIVLGALVLDEALAPRAYAGFAFLALGLAVIDGRILRLSHGTARG